MKPKILVPFDFSPEAARALAWAVDFAGTTHGTVHALHLVSMLPSLSMIGPLPAAGAATADMEGLQRELAERVARASSAATSSVSVCVSFGESVVTAAVDGGFDLIVMGTHGRGALLLGGNSRRKVQVFRRAEVHRRARVHLVEGEPGEGRARQRGGGQVRRGGGVAGHDPGVPAVSAAHCGRSRRGRPAQGAEVQRRHHDEAYSRRAARSVPSVTRGDAGAGECRPPRRRAGLPKTSPRGCRVLRAQRRPHPSRFSLRSRARPRLAAAHWSHLVFAEENVREV